MKKVEPQQKYRQTMYKTYVDLHASHKLFYVMIWC